MTDRVFNEEDLMQAVDTAHGCTDCYEKNRGFVTTKVGYKCVECGGKVLELQELLDYIAELKSDLRSLQEIYGEEV